MCRYDLRSPTNYKFVITHFSTFLRNNYPNIVSITDIPYDEANSKWIQYLKEQLGIYTSRSSIYTTVVRGPYHFFKDFYDEREEYEKDIWNFNKIPGTHLTDTNHQRTLNFTNVPHPFRDICKRYVKFKASFVSLGTCYHIMKGLEYFFSFIREKHPSWSDLVQLSREDIESFLAWYLSKVGKWTITKIRYAAYVRSGLEYMQLAGFPEAPATPIPRLFFSGDIPPYPKSNKKAKYIPEVVLQQLDEHLDKIYPPTHIPIIILLRASGWRTADIMALRYESCLDKTPQGWYLCGDITKTKILGHRIPITDEIACVVQASVKEAKKHSTDSNNPNKLLFPVYTGRRRGLCVSSNNIRSALNRLAKQYQIVDEAGDQFRFGNHAFRHTKAVELINNGMSLAHVQKWMAHTSPEMTLVYAHILDDTMRKSWEEATKSGLFRVDTEGVIRKIDLSEIENEDVIEWEYIRFNLDAVRMPLGYCMKPKKQDCHTQLNPCLTCRSLCTTPDFIPQYENEMRETKVIIERGLQQNREVWVQKNRALLARYESILSVLKAGKTHHAAGKKGREYIGEERAV